MNIDTEMSFDLVNPFPIGIVVSQFNKTISGMLQTSVLRRLKERGFTESDIHQLTVPGAVEIPIACQGLIKQQGVKAVIALGVVIKGETDHYQWVCQQVSYGCQRVALTLSVPVIFGVLTTETTLQAMARANGEHSDKGEEVVDAAITMATMFD